MKVRYPASYPNPVKIICRMTTMGPTVTINVLIQRYWIWGAFGCKVYGMTGAVCGKNHVRITQPWIRTST